LPILADPCRNFESARLDFYISQEFRKIDGGIFLFIGFRIRNYCGLRNNG